MKKCLLIFLFASFYNAAFSQATLVADINNVPAGMGASNDYSEQFMRAGNLVYFPVNDFLGRELWRSDGTTDGTFRIIDLYPGEGNGFGYVRVPIEEKLLFVGNDGKGDALWVTDGTQEGTNKVKDVVPDKFFSFKGSVYFTVSNSGSLDEKVWKTDGTPEGTAELPGSIYISTSTMGIGEERLFFFKTVYDGMSTIYELWESNLLVEGTHKVKDFPYANVGTVPNQMIVINDIVYFGANDNGGGNKLWRSDGTLLGTYSIEDGSVSDLAKFNENVLFNVSGQFKVTNGNIGAAQILYNTPVSGSSVVIDDIYYGLIGTDIIRTDGTPIGTQQIAQLGKVNLYHKLSALGDKIFVPYNTLNTTYNSQEPGVLDVTTNTITTLKEIYEGDQGSQPRSFIALNDKVLFLADDGTRGIEIWLTDGTEAGTQLLKDTKPGTGYSNIRLDGVLQDQLFFSAREGDASSTNRLWSSNGEGGGTLKVHNSQIMSTYGIINNGLYYFSDFKLYRIAGASESPVLLKDFSNSLTSFGTVSGSVTVGEKLFIWVRPKNGDYNTGMEPWVTDGTPEGTLLLKDINPGTASSGSTSGTELNGQLLFTANDGVHGAELWKSDGTEVGTQLVKDIAEGVSESAPASFAVLNGEVLFAATESVTGRELWKTDGTLAGTSLLKDLESGDVSSNPRLLTTVNNSLFFVANDGSNMAALWKTDGSASGTIKIKSFTGISNLSVLSGKLYFAANDGVNGTEFWTTDGTESGTQMIEIVPGPDSSNPGRLTDIEGVGYFVANNSTWKTKGTVETTKKVVNEYPSIPLGGILKYFVYYNSWVYFGADSEAHGDELFKVKHKNFQEISLAELSLVEFGAGDIDLMASSNSGLPITLTSSDNSIAEVVNGKLKILKPGTVSITATQSGNDDWEPTTISRSVEISKVNQTIEFPEIANRVLGDASFMLIASSSSGLPVTFNTVSERVRITGNQIELLAAGKVIIEATQTGNDYYNPHAISSNEFCINPPKPIITEDGFLLTSSSAEGNQWLKDGIVMEGATANTLFIMESGSYAVRTTINECTSEPSLPVQVIVAGLENSSLVEVYPNPVASKATVSLQAFSGQKEVKLLNAQGGVIFETNTNNLQQEIDLSIQPLGIYLLKINTKTQSVLVKIVKQ